MNKALLEIKEYINKYPWLFYYGLIALVSSSVLKYYAEASVTHFPNIFQWILTSILKSIFGVVIFTLIFTLISKYILDRHLSVEDKGYVYYPIKFLVVFIILGIISIGVLFQKDFILAIPFATTKTIFILKLKEISLLFVNLILFSIYRRKS